MNKKVNPRKKMVRLDEATRMAREASCKSVDAAWAIFFTVLRDKAGMDVEDLRRIWDAVNKLSASINEGYVTVSDLRNTLKQEAGIL